MKLTLWILIIFLFISCGGLQADDVKVKTSGGTEKISSYGADDALYYNLSQLNQLLIGRLEWITPGFSVRMILDTNRYEFMVGSPYVNINGNNFNMMVPALVKKGALYVPAEYFSPLLNLGRPENISWNQERRTLSIDAEWFHITDVAIMPKANGLLIEIFMTAPLHFEITESEGNWINIHFPDVRINTDKILSSIDRRHVWKINAFQFETSAQISFRLRRGYKKFHHTFKSNPGRLQISIEDALFNPDSLSTDINRIGPDEKIDVIVIDPGHGGSDYGAIGRNKRTREKEINLEIAEALAKLIRKDKQFKVVMTRTKDTYVSLDERARIANDAKADLFVSIHCNSSSKKQASGHQVFYLAPAKNDSARAIAQIENAPFLINDPGLDKNPEDDLAFILNDMIQTEFLTESADLAYMTDIEVRKKINIRPRGVDHAAFFVLNRVYMPSILIEAAFISNKDEENLLRKKSFRNDIAEAIYNSIKRFKAKYERI
ncbi:MAG: N-acetylmuramoyl-L-alanine amidase [Candidatus Zixiibacteriota bacterium]